MIDTDKYEGHTPAPWEWSSVERTQYEVEPHPDKLLAKDAPLLLEAYKRLRERLMLTESALGEVRAHHEYGQGNLGEILEHYRDKEGVEMPNAFDEVIE